MPGYLVKEDPCICTECGKPCHPPPDLCPGCRARAFKELWEDNLQDWTKDPETGEDSEQYLKLAGIIDEIIRTSAKDLIFGKSEKVARLILSKLAHEHGLAPIDWRTP